MSLYPKIILCLSHAVNTVIMPAKRSVSPPKKEHVQPRKCRQMNKNKTCYSLQNIERSSIKKFSRWLTGNRNELIIILTLHTCSQNNLKNSREDFQDFLDFGLWLEYKITNYKEYLGHNTGIWFSARNETLQNINWIFILEYYRHYFSQIWCMIFCFYH